MKCAMDAMDIGYKFFSFILSLIKLNIGRFLEIYKKAVLLFLIYNKYFEEWILFLNKKLFIIIYLLFINIFLIYHYSEKTKNHRK